MIDVHWGFLDDDDGGGGSGTMGWMVLLSTTDWQFL
jgi:hypothetical protein